MIVWTVAYITADQQSNWLDMLRIYQLGENSDPAFTQRIEFQDPTSGQFYYIEGLRLRVLARSRAPTRNSCVANSGHWVEKGIAAQRPRSTPTSWSPTATSSTP